MTDQEIETKIFDNCACAFWGGFILSCMVMGFGFWHIFPMKNQIEELKSRVEQLEKRN